MVAARGDLTPGRAGPGRSSAGTGFPVRRYPPPMDLDVRAELGDPDFTVDDDTPVVVERFRLVHVV